MKYLVLFFLTAITLLGCNKEAVKPDVEENTQHKMAPSQVQEILSKLPSDADKSKSNFSLQVVYIQSGTYLTQDGDIKIFPNEKANANAGWQGDARPVIPVQEAVVDKEIKKVLISLPEK